MSKTQDLIPGCKNHYTRESIYDYFMESEEDTQRCSGCKNLIYVSGTMSCRYLNEEEKV